MVSLRGFFFVRARILGRRAKSSAFWWFPGAQTPKSGRFAGRRAKSFAFFLLVVSRRKNTESLFFGGFQVQKHRKADDSLVGEPNLALFGGCQVQKHRKADDHLAPNHRFSVFLHLETTKQRMILAPAGWASAFRLCSLFPA